MLMGYFSKVKAAVPLMIMGIGLLITCWLGYILFLTKRENHACQAIPVMHQSNPNSPLYNQLQRVISEYSAQKGGIGLQATLIFPDDLTWTGVAGYADIHAQCPMTPSHHLYIGSMTKLYTAALIMEQVEVGALALDDPISHWINLPQTHGIRIRNLLNQTSGLPDYARDTWFQVRWFGLPGKLWQPIELASVIQDKPVRFYPGARHEYSNSNYLLLGMVLERVLGKPYQLILKKNICEKLGLRDTYFLSYPGDWVIANGYDESLLHLGRRNLTGFRRSLESGAYSAGGILSTSEDVARLLHALSNGQVVSDASLAEMKSFRDAPDVDMPEQTGYGLGLRHLVINGEDLIGHTGSIPGYSGIALHNDQRGYTIAILSNLSTIEQTELFAKVQQIIIKE